MRDRKLLTPHEAEIDKLLQIMAVLIGQLGGEVIINRHELEQYFDVPVLSEVISKDYVKLYLGGEDETSEVEIETDLPEENPQT
jgi:hypothetical protein